MYRITSGAAQLHITESGCNVQSCVQTLLHHRQHYPVSSSSPSPGVVHRLDIYIAHSDTSPDAKV